MAGRRRKAGKRGSASVLPAQARKGVRARQAPILPAGTLVPRPLDAAEILQTDLVSHPPAGFPVLTERQQAWIRYYAAHPASSLADCGEAAGYDRQSGAKMARHPAIMIYRAALVEGDSKVAASEAVPIAEQRRRILAQMARDAQDPANDPRERAFSAKIWLDSVQIPQEQPDDWKNLSMEELDERIQAVLASVEEHSQAVAPFINCRKERR